MRRLCAALAGAAMASGALVVLTSSPAAFATDCGASGGTVPGTPTQTFMIAVPGGPTFYIDDRDFADADDDGVSQGIWTYMESNGHADLQAGGDQFVLGSLPVSVPHLDPVPVGGPEPVGGVTTLFPNGFGGGNLAEAAGEHDQCADPSGVYDTVIW